MPPDTARVLAQQGNVERLQERLGAEWPSISAARENAGATIQRLLPRLRPIVRPDTTVVVFGSLARLELTAGSDVDWTLLVDGFADPLHWDDARRIEGRLREEKLRPPTSGGAFGSVTFSHDLIHRIGGEDDTNHNTTQRLLLLLESVPIGESSAYNRVLERVLERYVEEDLIGSNDTPYRVPRFLQNDIARYWRTMAVDFAHKRRVRGDGWALRTAKLRMSRKLIYAAGLLSCYSCDFGFPAARQARSLSSAYEAVLNHLGQLVRTTPLDIMAGAVLLYFGKFSGAAAELFAAYDAFLALLNDKEWRTRMKNLSPQSADTDEDYQDVRKLGNRFQDALTEMFLIRKTPLRDLTMRYGVF
ncbi:MAG TPA: nucleotidyltransferase domain-containing protein [Longimicrobium sp.]|nr:nucleotidyltransferase domain-containing protein [Longimicrobium sp.]